MLWQYLREKNMSSININIDELTDKQAIDELFNLLENIKTNTKEMNHGDSTRRILAEVIDALDELDGYDMFGTEGWKHTFGYED